MPDWATTLPSLPPTATRRLAAPPLVLFAVFSALLHGGAFVAVHARKIRVAPALAFDRASPALVGETLDVEPAGPDPGAEAAEAPEPVPEGAHTLAPDTARMSPRAGMPATHAPRPGSSPAAPGGARLALFGAVGVRFATDLATTFTRAFPQAASADPVWATAPFGDAGAADVMLTLDETGHLTGSAITGAPSPALRRGIERTLALLGPRTFTARGASTRLRVLARVGTDDVHDGLHGDVFALSGGSFAGEVGTAFFALPASGGPGRRIDLELRLVP